MSRSFRLSRPIPPILVPFRSVRRRRIGPTAPPTAASPPDAQFHSTPSEDWLTTDRDRLGVLAKDPVGHLIGPNIAKRRFVGLNWYPIDRVKQTLVGTIERYQFYNPWHSGDEADWNIFMRPSTAFGFIRDDAVSNADASEVHRSDRDGAILVEAEITPDEHFYDNPYFNADGSSSLVGREIGVYGPWVGEEAHGFRPEIHPCELLWWRDVNPQGLRTWHLMIVQDDSNRFDRADNYSGTIDHPWSEFPRIGEFRVAVSVAPNQLKRISLEQLQNRNVVRPNVVDHRPVSRTFARGPRLLSRIEVNWDSPGGPNIEIALDGFETDSSGVSRGFVVLRTKVGTGDRGSEGYQVLRATESIRDSLFQEDAVAQGDVVQ